MSTKRERTREKILESAQQLFALHGYHGVGLEEVARSAGVSRQAVYLHFASKADLVVAMVRSFDESAGTPSALRPIQEATSAVDALNRGVEAYGAIEPNIYDAASVLYAARRSDEAAEAAWQDRMAFRRANILQTIEGLEREGRLAKEWTVDEATDFAWTLVSVHTYEYLVIERGWTVEQLVRRLQQILRVALVSDADD